MTEHAPEPPAAIGARRTRWRTIIDEVQRWQNLLSAVIALGAAVIAWSFIQKQIDVQQSQAKAAQVQASIAHSDLLARRILDLELVRTKLQDFKFRAHVLRRDAPRWTVTADDGKNRLETTEEFRARKVKAVTLVDELEQIASRLPRTEAIASAVELASKLQALRIEAGVWPKNRGWAVFQPQEEAIAMHERLMKEIDVLDGKLSGELTSLTERLRKIEAALR